MIEATGKKHIHLCENDRRVLLLYSKINISQAVVKNIPNLEYPECLYPVFFMEGNNAITISEEEYSECFRIKPVL